MRSLRAIKLNSKLIITTIRIPPLNDDNSANEFTIIYLPRTYVRLKVILVGTAITGKTIF